MSLRMWCKVVCIFVYSSAWIGGMGMNYDNSYSG